MIVILLLLAGGCGAQGGPAATPPPQPTIALVSEALARPAGEPFEAIGYLYRTPEGAALIGGLSSGPAGAPAPLADGGQIWLDSPPTPPAAGSPEAAGATPYPIVRARGQLAPPGAYGPGGAYRHQLAQAQIEPLSVRDLSIALLLGNAPIYVNQPVRISGQLLLNRGTALLIERIGPGGVPGSDALQIKLSGPIDSASLRAALPAASGSAAHFGPVQVIGIWRDGTLTPLSISPA